MDRESYLRSLPYLHPSSWPAPSASRAYGGAYIRKLMFSGHVVSIEPSSSQPGTMLGPAFFVTDEIVAMAAPVDTEGGVPAIDDDPALCPFEASVLVPKSIAGVSPGASSASTAFASSQSPVGTTPAPAGKATPAATSAQLAMSATSTSGLSDTPKQTDAPPEPTLYFRFGGNGTYCVNYSCVRSITVETGVNYQNRAEGSQGGETGRQTVSIPPSIVISFDSCSFRIFQLATQASDKNTREEQVKNLRLSVSELNASLRAAGSFVPPPSPSVEKDSSGDTQISDRTSLEECGQLLGGGIGSESTGGTCSEGNGQSQATDGDTNTLQMREDGKDTFRPSQQSLTTEEDTQQILAGTKEDKGIERVTEAVSKRRRIAYNQSVSAINCIGAIVDPISSTVDCSTQRVGTGAAAQKQLSSLMKVAATALVTSYEVANGESSSEDQVDQITASLDDTVSEFIPVHTRVKQQRGGVLSSLSMSSPPPAKRLDSTAPPAQGLTGDDDLARDADQLRDIARKLIDEYRLAIAAKHMWEVLPSR